MFWRIFDYPINEDLIEIFLKSKLFIFFDYYIFGNILENRDLAEFLICESFMDLEIFWLILDITKEDFGQKMINQLMEYLNVNSTSNRY